MAPSAAPISRAFRFANLVAAIPDFGLAGFFAISWVAPYAFGAFYYATIAVTELFGVGAPPVSTPEAIPAGVR
jgi:hypothetical protein